MSVATRRSVRPAARIKRLQTLLFKSTALAFALAASGCANTPTTPSPKSGNPSAVIDIPFQKFQLDNGLTVVVHEDHKAPVVAVSIWYHVGSGDEPKGKTGFAHLFEHLMFSGSENHKGTYFKPFEVAGATDMNGTTWLDRTNYFETVPTTALDMALWMESDRMGHLLSAIGKPELDTQRGVVQNEKRQGENRPYGRTGENIQLQCVSGQPSLPARRRSVRWPISTRPRSTTSSNGSATTTARPTRRSCSPATSPRRSPRRKCRNTSAIFPPDRRCPVSRHGLRRAAHPRAARSPIMSRRCASIREWNVPQLGNADTPLLDLAAAVLGGGKTSRLYQRLVYQDKLVDEVSVHVQTFALASQFELRADVKKGVDPARVEAAIADEWAKFLKNGPTEDELARAKTGIRARFIRGMEKVGGFGGKAVILAESQVYSRRSGRLQDRTCAQCGRDTGERARRRAEVDRARRLYADRGAGQTRRGSCRRGQGRERSARRAWQTGCRAAGCKKVYCYRKRCRAQQGRTRGRAVSRT